MSTMETSAMGNQPGSGNPSASQQSASYQDQQGADAFDAAYQTRRNTRVATLVLASVLFFLIGYAVGRREEERSRRSLTDHLSRQLQDWFSQSGRALSDLRDPLEHGIRASSEALQQGIRTSGEALQHGLRSSGETLGDFWSKAASLKTAASTSKAAAKLAKSLQKKQQHKFLGVF